MPTFISARQVKCSFVSTPKNIMIVSKNELKCHYLKAQSINPSLLSHSYGVAVVAALTKK